MGVISGHLGKRRRLARLVESGSQIDVRVVPVRRPSWSRLRSGARPALELELRLLLELLGVLAEVRSPARVMVLPSNVLIGADGSVLLGPSRPGDLEVQKRYLAPEASAHEGEASGDLSSVIYAVGALLFEAVSGEVFESSAVVEKEVLAARVAAKAAGLGSNHWELELLEIAATATRVEPRQRWSSPTVFSEALRQAAEGRFASQEELAEYAVRFSSDSDPPPSRESASPVANVPASAREAHQTLLGVGAVAVPHPEAAEQSAPKHQTLLGVGVPSVKPDEAADPGGVRHQTLLGVGAPPVPGPEAAEPDGTKHQTLPGMGAPVEHQQEPEGGAGNEQAPTCETAAHEESSLDFDAEESSDIGAILTNGRPRGRRSALFVIATLIVAMGAVGPLAYYAGYLEWVGLGAPPDRDSEVIETGVDAARVEAAAEQQVSQPETPSASSTSSSSASLEQGGAPQTVGRASRDGGPDDGAADSEPRTSPESKPPATGRPKAPATGRPQAVPPVPRPPPSPAPRSTELPAVRDYGI